MRNKMHGLWGGESCAVQAIDSLHRPEHRGDINKDKAWFADCYKGLQVHFT